MGIRKTIESYYSRFRNIILYGIIGSISSGVDFLVFSLLTNFIHLDYIIANCISVLFGIGLSFLLNRKYNFKVKDKTIRRFFTFLSIGITGLVLSNIILYIAIDIFMINELISKILSICLVVIMQFIANNFITFRTSK